ncbi:MAG: SpoIIAA family protein [Candidatus Dormibacteraceae bacterium]
MAEGIVKGDVSHVEGTYFNQPGVAVVTWDASCKATHIEWQGWADPAEFRAANQAIIRALKEHRGSRALGDLRRIKAIQQSDQDWAQAEWLPEVLAAGLRQMALVVPLSGLAMMNVEAILSRVPGTKLDIAYFATIEEARAWLSRPRSITPAALEADPRG